MKYKMVTKKKSVVRKVSKKPVKSKVVKNPWFKTTNFKNDWGFVPINFNGGVALFILIAINVFAANYFRLGYLIADNWFKFGVVFFLSMFIFIMISKKKIV